jgi:RsiW-degrading membrane proteinase PrsW (M82 family)
MRYFYHDASSGRVGPCTIEELRRLYFAGVVRPDTLLVPEAGEPGILFKELWGHLAATSGHGFSSASPSTPPPLPNSLPAPSDEPGFTRRAGDDLRTMLPHLTLPLEELKTFRWLDNRKALAIAGIGLLPLVIYAAFGGRPQLGNAFWAMALYFSVLWALFFYYVFPTPEARFSIASLCFFATGVISISILLQMYRVWPLSALLQWTRPVNWFAVQWLGYVFGVGVPEELCKALVLLFIVKRFAPIPPQAMLFYGLMAGLGFGIYEGISYQTSHNFRFAIDAAGYRDHATFAAEYYLLNLIRLTTLPFLHAIWTGMAGYFIGFAAQFPARKRGLLIVAIGVPALLHDSYNAFGSAALGLLIALISVLALNLYLAKSVDFEKLLAQRKPE